MSNLVLPIPFNLALLGAFARLQKANIGFVVSLCLSVRMGQLGSNWTGFHAIWYLKIVKKFSIEFKVY
jgi:hypothetical protein